MKSLLRSKTILGIIASLILVSCDDNHTEQPINVSFDIRLPQDKNGFYHLNINKQSWQTLHRVSGLIQDKNKGIENFWVEWDSDLYWYLGDTLGYIVNRGFSLYTGNYVSVDTSYMIGFDGQEVPTSNKISYSNSKGEVNNMIAPVKSMIGDTMRLTASWFDNSENFYIILK
jgi:hypothetical protein